MNKEMVYVDYCCGLARQTAIHEAPGGTVRQPSFCQQKSLHWKELSSTAGLQHVLLTGKLVMMESI
jgi:hypothetical protein